jgi:hypothetical protein
MSCTQRSATTGSTLAARSARTAQAASAARASSDLLDPARHPVAVQRR